MVQGPRAPRPTRPSETKELTEPPLLGGPTPPPVSTSLMLGPPSPHFRSLTASLIIRGPNLTKEAAQGWGLVAEGRAGRDGHRRVGAGQAVISGAG